MYYPTVFERREKCFEKLASISKEKDETLTNYYSSLAAEIVDHKKRDVTTELWQMHEKLKNEYAKTYSSCLEVIRPQ